MAVELVVPGMGESINEVQLGRWLVAEGEHVEADAPVVELESDKATVELPAPVAGVLSRQAKQPGDTAAIGEVIGYLEASEAPAAKPAARPGKPSRKPGAEVPAVAAIPPEVPAAPEPAAVAEPELADDEAAEEVEEDVDAEAPGAAAAPAAPHPSEPVGPHGTATTRVMPAARRILREYGLSVQDVVPSGPGGRLLKEDALRAAEGRAPVRRDVEPPAPPEPPEQEAPGRAGRVSAPAPGAELRDEVVPMTPMRRRIAERLVQAQQAAALLTTFNEVDLGEVVAWRERHRQAFQDAHGVKLGYMPFFVKATVSALQAMPRLNAEIRGTDIVYHKYYDIGIAIGGGKGLVVPVLRDADRLSFAGIEKAIADFAQQARDNKLALEDLQGGTFTITNGGIYGSLLSTPIVNPPQSGILGMHAIQDRPVARAGQVVIRPMMYVALTYDHRLVDGREAVTFLKHIKDSLEAPERLLLEL